MLYEKIKYIFHAELVLYVYSEYGGRKKNVGQYSLGQ